MKLKVFGQLVDIVGTDSFDVIDANDSDELVNQLETKFPPLKNVKFKVAVNRNIIQSNTILKRDAEIALLPPFSGG